MASSIPAGIANVTYTNTYPNLERVGSLAAEAKVSTFIENNLQGSSSIAAIVGLEALNFRDGTTQLIRHVSADIQVQRVDNSQTIIKNNGFVARTTEHYSPQGSLQHRVNTSGSGFTHTEYKNNALHSTHVYPREGGSYNYDVQGNFQGVSGCTIS